MTFATRLFRRSIKTRFWSVLTLILHYKTVCHSPPSYDRLLAFAYPRRVTSAAHHALF